MTVTKVQSNLQTATWICIVCNAVVIAEANTKYDKQGNREYYYTPASRYWSALGDVYCGPQHSLEHKSKLSQV